MVATEKSAGAASALKLDAARERREREARWLDEARAMAEQHRTVSEAQVDAWIDSLGETAQAPPPVADA